MTIPRNELERHIGTHSMYRNCTHDPVHEWNERGDCIAAKAASHTGRVKHVYSTGEIPHLWAHKTQATAHNPQHNLYFEHGTIYSYGSHFPIAKHYQNSTRACILFTTGRNSVTTAGHIHSVRMAIPGSVPVFDVPRIEANEYHHDHETNLASYVDSDQQGNRRIRSRSFVLSQGIRT